MQHVFSSDKLRSTISLFKKLLGISLLGAESWLSIAMAMFEYISWRLVIVHFFEKMKPNHFVRIELCIFGDFRLYQTNQIWKINVEANWKFENVKRLSFSWIKFIWFIWIASRNIDVWLKDFRPLKVFQKIKMWETLTEIERTLEYANSYS